MTLENIVKTGHLYIQVLMKMTTQEPFILLTVQPEKMKSFLTTFALSVVDQLKKSYLTAKIFESGPMPTP